jgi:hypothetical protein
MMKKYFTIFAGVVATALITTGCEPLTYAQTDNNGGYYAPPPDNGYNYGDGYSDAQGDNYDYSQQPGITYQQSAAQPMGFNDFYNQLSPYGSWVNVAPYGQVWVANLPNFQPYSTNGYWTYTTYGWTWVSNYPWGWAPFHYGRWGYSNIYGWYWVPGYVWGPAWVAWSSSSDMYGWAPLMPGMHFGVTLSMGLFPSSYWTFMPGRYMGMNNIGNYFVNRSRNVTIIKNTTIINNYGVENNRHYTMGPRATDVQRYTGRSIQPMRVTNAADNKSTGVNSNELRVYRPVTRAANTSSNRGATNNSANNRTVAPQTRNTQQTNRAATPQTRGEQPAQQQANRTATPQTRSEQPAQQQAAVQRAYKPNPAQPKVTNTAAPQTSRQVQAAQTEYKRVQQARPATPAHTTPARSSAPARTNAQPRR